MISVDEMRELIREEVCRGLQEAARRVSKDSRLDDEYDEYGWKNNVSYEYLVRTNQHLDI